MSGISVSIGTRHNCDACGTHENTVAYVGIGSLWSAWLCAKCAATLATGLAGLSFVDVTLQGATANVSTSNASTPSITDDPEFIALIDRALTGKSMPWHSAPDPGELQRLGIMYVGMLADPSTWNMTSLDKAREHTAFVIALLYRHLQLAEKTS